MEAAVVTAALSADALSAFSKSSGCAMICVNLRQFPGTMPEYMTSRDLGIRPGSEL